MRGFSSSSSRSSSSKG